MASAIYAVLIRPDEKPQRIVTEQDLQSLRTLIGGGWLENVSLPDGSNLLVDEEGKLKDLPVNEFATFVAMGVLVGDYINGTALLVGPTTAGGHLTDAPIQPWETT